MRDLLYSSFEIRELMRHNKEVVSRRTADKQKLPWYFTGTSCVNGHIDLRSVGDRGCLKCKSEKQNLKRVKGYSEKDSPVSEERRLQRLETARQWKLRNPEKIQVQRTRWRNENRTKVRAANLNRKKHVKQATPPWLSDTDKKIIMLQYHMRDSLTKLTGTQYSIEHIVPLRGENVCGLHAPWNIEVIPVSRNSSKGNSFNGIC